MANLNIDWKTPDIKIKEPKPDEDEQEFVGQDLEVVQKHAKFIKLTLKTMGIKDRDDRNEVIERIKILITKEEDAPTDVWDKNSQKKELDDGKRKSKKPGDWD